MHQVMTVEYILMLLFACVCTVQPRVLAFDRLVSLVLYFVAAICIADVLGFALRSLLAVGGISGIPVKSPL